MPWVFSSVWQSVKISSSEDRQGMKPHWYAPMLRMICGFSRLHTMDVTILCAIAFPMDRSYDVLHSAGICYSIHIFTNSRWNAMLKGDSSVILEITYIAFLVDRRYYASTQASFHPSLVLLFKGHLLFLGMFLKIHCFRCHLTVFWNSLSI